VPTIHVTHALTRPPPEVGDRLLHLTEDQWFDRKSVRISAQKLVDAEISFANAEGGTLVVGLSGAAVEGTDGHANTGMR